MIWTKNIKKKVVTVLSLVLWRVSRVVFTYFIILPNGACYWRLPISAFFQKSFHRTQVPDMSVDELELWNCFSYYPSVTEFDFLGWFKWQIYGQR